MRIFFSIDQKIKPDYFPSINLSHDIWDDYGFKTTFFVRFFESQDKIIDLSKVKIISSGMKGGFTKLESTYDEELPENFASLGSDFDYYKILFNLSLGEEILQSLRDIAIDPTHAARFESEEAYTLSLMRLSPAKDALHRVRSLRPKTPPTDPTIIFSEQAPEPPAESTLNALKGNNNEPAAAITEPLKLKFTPSAHTEKYLQPNSILFDFEGPKGLPTNLIALVGPNGTGKTTLLSDLAQAVFFGEGSPDPADQAGSVEILKGAARDVLFVSYSAYDSFKIPATQSLEGDVRKQLSDQGYTYIGLRKLSSDEISDHNDVRARQITLKSIAEIETEFTEYLDGISSPSKNEEKKDSNTRLSYFITSVKSLWSDPSISAIKPLPRGAGAERIITFVREIFPEMSTGHKAILNIIASLCCHMKQNSLLIMDEPEAHLHPPLIASLLTITRNLLTKFNANAIVATHSPVVVQETLAQHVILLQRNDQYTSWKVSPTQTFGEHIGALTNRTFGLPAAKADYIGKLEELVRSNASLDDIENLFGERRMSSPARAQTIRLIAQIKGGGLKP